MELQRAGCRVGWVRLADRAAPRQAEAGSVDPGSGLLVVALPGDPAGYAAQLYATLHCVLDNAGVERILEIGPRRRMAGWRFAIGYGERRPLQRAVLEGAASEGYNGGGNFWQAVWEILMQLKVKSAESCRYDIVSLGEVMLRLDPGEGRIRTARSVPGLGGRRRIQRGPRAAALLRHARRPWSPPSRQRGGRLVEDLILQGGVDTDLIRWVPYDGIGRTVRNGLNFTERGFGVRGAVGRAGPGHTAASQLQAGRHRLGGHLRPAGRALVPHRRHLRRPVRDHGRGGHRGGAGGAEARHHRLLRPELPPVALEGDRRAGTRPQEVNREIAQYVDVMIGNEEDFTACLGFEVEGVDDEPDRTRGRQLQEDDRARRSRPIPNFKATATTLRGVKTATVNDWGAICWYDGEFHVGDPSPRIWRSWTGSAAATALPPG